MKKLLKLLKSRVFIAVVCLLVAVALVAGVLPGMYAEKTKNVTVVKLAKDIEEGTMITAEMLTTVEVGSYGLPENLVTNGNTIIGLVSNRPLLKDDLLFQNEFEDATSQEDASIQELLEQNVFNVDDGKMVITISLNGGAATVGNALTTGSAVNIAYYDATVSVDASTGVSTSYLLQDQAFIGYTESGTPTGSYVYNSEIGEFVANSAFEEDDVFTDTDGITYKFNSKTGKMEVTNTVEEDNMSNATVYQNVSTGGYFIVEDGKLIPVEFGDTENYIYISSNSNAAYAIDKSSGTLEQMNVLENPSAENGNKFVISKVSADADTTTHVVFPEKLQHMVIYKLMNSNYVDISTIREQMQSAESSYTEADLVPSYATFVVTEEQARMLINIQSGGKTFYLTYDQKTTDAIADGSYFETPAESETVEGEVKADKSNVKELEFYDVFGYKANSGDSAFSQEDSSEPATTIDISGENDLDVGGGADNVFYDDPTDTESNDVTEEQ